MKNKMSAKFSRPCLSLVFSFLMLCPLLVINAQTTSTNLEDTQWIAKPFSMVNVDASITVITSTYYFYKQGKFKLYTFANKGVGISSVDGKLTFPFASDTEVFGTYKVEGKSVYLYFPNETISATISGNQMKGVSTLKGTNKKEEWLVEKFIPENKSTNSVKESSGATSVTAQQQIQAASDYSKSKPLKTLPQQVIEKYNPTKLTSNTISGNLSGGNGEKYFYFTAVPGDLTVTLTVIADAQSSLNSVWATLFDPNETSPYSEYKTLGYATTMTNYGRTMQNTQKITVSERMPILLQIKANNNLGTGRYKVQLEGAYEIE